VSGSPIIAANLLPKPVVAKYSPIIKEHIWRCPIYVLKGQGYEERLNSPPVMGTYMPTPTTYIGRGSSSFQIAVAAVIHKNPVSMIMKSPTF